MVGLVVPVYNEELRWRSSYFKEIAALDKVKLLFVNDGSQDGTITLIKQISEEFLNVSYLDLENNSGKAEALRLGLLKLTSQPEIKLIGFLDADGAFATSDISRILKSIQSQDLSAESSNNTWWWTSRKKMQDNKINRKLSRHIIGRAIALIIQCGYSKLPYDTQSGFKIFQISSEIISSLQIPFETSWFFEIELLIRMNNSPNYVVNLIELVLDCWCEIPGSKIGFKNMPNVFLQVLLIKKIQFEGRRHKDSWGYNGY